MLLFFTTKVTTRNHTPTAGISPRDLISLKGSHFRSAAGKKALVSSLTEFALFGIAETTHLQCRCQVDLRDLFRKTNPGYRLRSTLSVSSPPPAPGRRCGGPGPAGPGAQSPRLVCPLPSFQIKADWTGGFVNLGKSWFNTVSAQLYPWFPIASRLKTFFIVSCY